MFALGDFNAPTSGGASSFALRLLTGDGSSGLMGDEITTSSPSDVKSGALVACGSAGRCCKNGEGPSFVVDDAITPTPDGVGVNGGGLTGDSEAAFPLRFFGSGVEGSSGIAKPDSPLFVTAPSCRSVRGALLLRFFGAAAGFFSTLVYLASTLVVVPSTVVVLATRAERLRDMLIGLLALLLRVLVVREV